MTDALMKNCSFWNVYGYKKKVKNITAKKKNVNQEFKLLPSQITIRIAKF